MKYPELKEFHDAYRKAGYDLSLFEALVTTAPDALKVMQGASLTGYKAGRELTLTPGGFDVVTTSRKDFDNLQSIKKAIK